MKHTFLVLAIILASTGLLFANQQNSQTPTTIANDLSQANQKEWDSLRTQLAKRADLLAGGIWGLVHVSQSKAEVKEAIDLFGAIYSTIASNDPASLKSFEGPDGFKSQLLKLMKSKDGVVAGFAATILAGIGDLNYAPQIADLLDTKGDTSGDDYPPVTVRGTAATALGLLGATKYTERIVPLLRSKNAYDRSGAAMALGYLKATGHAKDVVALLLSEEFSFPDNDSPIWSLVEMGVAASYKKEIAQVLGEKSRSETSIAAAYALAHLRAREFAPDIAKLLRVEFRKGDAAKALALMGAQEYAGQIARLLKDKNPLNRADAAQALGILRARKYAPAVANLLNDRESWVPNSAANALILMGASRYAKKVLPLARQPDEFGVYIPAGEFHQLVQEETRELDSRFKRELARMKAETK